MGSSRLRNIDLYKFSNSSRRIDDDFDSTYYIYSTDIQFQNDPMRYQISRYLYPEDFNAYTRGDEFYTIMEEIVGENAQALREAETLQARDKIMRQTMGSEITLVTDKSDIILLKKLNFDSHWKTSRDEKENIINLFKGYIPSFAIFGIFKHRENIAKAREIIRKLSTESMGREEILDYLKQIHAEFNPVNPQGEFNRKLYYAIRKLTLTDTAPRVELRSIRQT
jgi:hypothetical protein